MKTCLVTGGAGFIGANFIKYIHREMPDLQLLNLDKLTYAGNLENLQELEGDPRYRFVLGDVCDRELVERLFAEYPIDWVVNFAAESHVDRCILQPEAFVQTNVVGTLTLLQAARQAWQTGEEDYRPGVKFLQVSTDEVYGALGAEGFFTEESPLNPHSPYSASKASADLLVKSFADTFRLPVNITRCSNNYGPYQFPEKLIPLMLHNALGGQPLPVYGDGLQVRDWLYVKDHCRALALVLQQGLPGEVYNIGGHNERTNLAIVQAILGCLRQAGYPVEPSLIRHVQDRKGHDRRYAIDPAKIGRELGWRPETAFEEGLGQTVAWYLAHREWMEHLTGGEYQTYYARVYGSRLGSDGGGA